MDVKSRYIVVALMAAFVVAFETIAVEGALNIANIDIFLVSSVPSIIGGIILVGIYPRSTVAFTRSLGTRGWVIMLGLCAIIAAGVLLWFDSVGKIGASKEAILGGGSSEVLFVIILSAIFLSERLSLIEGVGSVFIIVGVFVVLTDIESLSLTLGLGEIEAIMSSLLLGTAVVVTTSLLKSYDLTPLSGVELLVSGIMVMTFGTVTGLIVLPHLSAWVLLVLLGLFPAVGLLMYNAPLPKIGASLTSVLFALNGIFTVGVQLLVLAIFPDADLRLPQNVGLAVFGGAIAFVGVYLLNRTQASEKAEFAPRLV